LEFPDKPAAPATCSAPDAIVGQRYGQALLKQSGLSLLLLAISLASWAFLVWLTVDMSHPFAQLTMPESSRWEIANLLSIFVMWAVMMAAMMLPSAFPMILTFIQVSQRQSQPLRAGSFILAYLLVWSAFSVLAMFFQWLVQRLGWVDSMLVSRSSWLTGLLLLLAGGYQLSRNKQVCLGRCRTPFVFLLGEWRAGTRGAFVMGLRHGLFCTGCCWALMGLLFVGGVMNLAWIAALSVVVAMEKLMPQGDKIAQVLGWLLMAVGLYKLLRLLS